MKTELLLALVPLAFAAVGAILNVVFRARTEAEYAALPRWQAIVVFNVRKVCPDFGPVVALIAQAILRQYTPPRPGVESLPQPPGAPTEPLVFPKSTPTVIVQSLPVTITTPEKEGDDGPA